MQRHHNKEWHPNYVDHISYSTNHLQYATILFKNGKEYKKKNSVEQKLKPMGKFLQAKESIARKTQPILRLKSSQMNSRITILY